MTRFNPTTRIMLPENQPDLLAGAVLDGLMRPTHGELSWEFGRALITTLITLGVLPLMAILRKLHGLIAHQSQQLWHLAEWLRLHSGDPDADQLQKASQQIRFNWTLAVLQVFFIAICMAGAAMHFAVIPFSLRELFRFAYHIPASPEAMIFTFSLLASAMCYVVHLVWHQRNVDRYIEAFNELTSRQGLDPVRRPKLEIGLRPLWLGAGLIVAATGALWALPVLLAAGAHRRYTKVASRRTRRELAARFRAMLLAQRPVLDVPPLMPSPACVRPHCQAPLPGGANFCPRCGTRVAKTMNVVA